LLGLDKIAKKIKKAVDKVVEPVPLLRDAVHATESLVKDLAHRYNEYLNGERTGIKPLHGGTNWDAYHHSELYDFVHVDASPEQVLGQVTHWDRHATDLRAKGEAVGKQWDSVRAAWQGVAAQTAGTRAQDIRSHAGVAADWATTVATHLTEVATALRKAKADMPPPPDHPLANVLEGSAVAGVSAAPTGPLSAGVRALATAGFGTFEQHQKNLAAKKKAIHVMQAYERAMIVPPPQPPSPPPPPPPPPPWPTDWTSPDETTVDNRPAGTGRAVVDRRRHARGTADRCRRRLERPGHNDDPGEHCRSVDRTGHGRRLADLARCGCAVAAAEHRARLVAELRQRREHRRLLGRRPAR
jgi:hypothetical protein